jgi:hypothetical protein
MIRATCAQTAAMRRSARPGGTGEACATGAKAERAKNVQDRAKSKPRICTPRPAPGPMREMSTSADAPSAPR